MPFEQWTNTRRGFDILISNFAVGDVSVAPQTASIVERAPITLGGTYVALDARAPELGDENACEDSLVLDAPVHLVDAKGKPARDGRGLGAHPVIGDANKVCLGAWKGEDHPLLPSGSHLVVQGTLTGPIVRSNPRAILMFDTAITSVTPPP